MQASAGGARSFPDKPVPMNLTAQAYLHRMDSLAAMQAAWSPVCALTANGDTGTFTPSVSSCCFVLACLGLNWLCFGLIIKCELEGPCVQDHAASCSSLHAQQKRSESAVCAVLMRG